MFEKGTSRFGIGPLSQLAATEPSDRADWHLVAIRRVCLIVPDDNLKPSRPHLSIEASSGIKRTKRFGQITLDRTVVDDDGTCIYLIRIEVGISGIPYTHP